MRIAYVCADPGIPVFGTKGASVHVQEVVRVLLEAGHAVDLFCRRTGGEPWPAAAAARAEGRLTVHELGRIRGEDVADRERRAMAADGDMLRAVTAGGPFDAVYERYSLWSTAGTTYARERGVPAVLEVNAPLPAEQARHRGLVHADEAHAVVRRAATGASAVVCVSEPVAAWVRDLAPGAAVVVEANGVDVTRIRPAAGRPDRPFTVGFVGTLKPWHGTETVLEAHALLRRSVPDARLLLVGDGPQAEALRQQARTLGTAGAVEATGAVAPVDVPTLLHRMDVATAPYPAAGEGYFSPLKAYEYMAAGLPVVASAVGQLPGVVEHGRTGFLVPGSDPTALAGTLGMLAGDRRLRAQVGRAAREHVASGHTWTHVVERSLAAAGLRLRVGSSALGDNSTVGDNSTLGDNSTVGDKPGVGERERVGVGS
ncbi:Glycosyltransferase involved in cell wall bisynthesis [Georgenia satyanarayanai]|uniref:Glycosyltransferase involved in cell wall bisynthesis n=1 Tax=Georgenia satyanarayanai TaxID=860221 RepID=A0A2Y9A6F3_9MICO|nr:glycosyltransferase family 4 protein [Georgenia satyanarayanai]PYG00470.1 glycosyltransferase involved in cell wall biosynthesis [Georgenia satyanarayanai]SSA39855.1 Glycosyltransferase involved in cell wall bisynthesis [Georgenia satyanarayanai]